MSSHHSSLFPRVRLHAAFKWPFFPLHPPPPLHAHMHRKLRHTRRQTSKKKHEGGGEELEDELLKVLRVIPFPDGRCSHGWKFRKCAEEWIEERLGQLRRFSGLHAALFHQLVQLSQPWRPQKFSWCMCPTPTPVWGYRFKGNPLFGGGWLCLSLYPLSVSHPLALCLSLSPLA